MWNENAKVYALTENDTARKIRIPAFYCMLGISLLRYVHQQAKAGWADLSVEQLLEELEQVKQFVLLYPPQGEKGRRAPPRCFRNRLWPNKPWSRLSGLQRWHRSTPRGQDNTTFVTPSKILTYKLVDSPHSKLPLGQV
jgi:hypothetical protein